MSAMPDICEREAMSRARFADWLVLAAFRRRTLVLDRKGPQTSSEMRMQLVSGSSNVKM